MLFGCYSICYLDTLKPKNRLDLDSICKHYLQSYRLVLPFDLKVCELHVIEPSSLTM